MSFELVVTGGRVVSLARWQKRLGWLGARVTFHPDFHFETHVGLLPVSIAVENVTLFRGAERYHGPLAAAFELGVWALGASADVTQVASRRAHFEAMRAAQPDNPSDFPEVMLRSLERERQDLSFTTNTGRTGADYLAQVLCAACYAIESGGRLENVSEGTSHDGDAIFSAVARMLADFLDDEDTVVGAHFDNWR